MKLVTNIQLLPTHEQAVALYDLVQRCNAASAWLSNVPGSQRCSNSA